MASKERNDFLDRLQYLAVRIVSMMMQCWPVNANLRAAKGLGNLLYRVDRKHRERALANLSDFVFGVREKQGQRIIAKKGATGDVVDVIEAGGAVGFVADQNAGSKGIFVDFFGRKASTYKSIGLLAMQYNAPVVIGYSRRLNDQFKCAVGAQDVIYPDDWKSQDDPLRYITQRYTKALEDIVRQDPGQYWWVHRRWKTRPKGETAEAYD